MTKKIQIKTAISPSIYSSQGGGTTRTESTHRATPRGFMRALRRVSDTATRARRSYGNCGATTYIEIGEHQIDEFVAGSLLLQIEMQRDDYREPMLPEAARILAAYI